MLCDGNENGKFNFYDKIPIAKYSYFINFQHFGNVHGNLKFHSNHECSTFLDIYYNRKCDHSWGTESLRHPTGKNIFQRHFCDIHGPYQTISGILKPEFQGVVTTTCAVLPPATAIIVKMGAWSFNSSLEACLIAWSTFSGVLIAWLFVVNGHIYKWIQSGHAHFPFMRSVWDQNVCKSPSQMEVQGILLWLPLEFYEYVVFTSCSDA